MNAFEASGLGKCYGSTWALRECTLAVPRDHVVALVGPNGAGKTTLLHSIVGLCQPTTGGVTVLHGIPAGSPEALERVAFVAQNAPLHQHLTVAAMIELSCALNEGFDRSMAERRLRSLKIPFRRRVGRLSGGQQAQLALSLALGRRPDLLVLDEPLAPLDPLARHDFMSQLMEEVAERGLSIVFSSHVVSELKEVADYLVVLSEGRVQLSGEIDGLLAAHSSWSGPAAEVEAIQAAAPVVQVERADRYARLLVRAPVDEVPAGWDANPVTIEDLVLAYLRSPDLQVPAAPLALAGANSRRWPS